MGLITIHLLVLAKIAVKEDIHLKIKILLLIEKIVTTLGSKILETQIKA
jgi:hypothetical protein